jgi:hypothetical protein
VDETVFNISSAELLDSTTRKVGSQVVRGLVYLTDVGFYSSKP